MLNITFVTNGAKVVAAPDNSNLLRVSLREKGGIPFKCGAGLCGTCKCRIEVGMENTDVIKNKERKHLSDEDFRQGFRMACQTFLHGDVSVSWEVKPIRNESSLVRQDGPTGDGAPASPEPSAPSL